MLPPPPPGGGTHPLSPAPPATPQPRNPATITPSLPSIKTLPYHHRPHQSIYRQQHSWVTARHHFSFGDYQDAKWIQHGALRVVNDDTLQPQKGVPMHPHHDMEIITIVRQGAVSHVDNLGNKGQITAGEIQIMSAGSGIRHSEYNQGDTPLVLYQIWLLPETPSVAPRWGQARRPLTAATEHPHSDAPLLLVSGCHEDHDQPTTEAPATTTHAASSSHPRDSKGGNFPLYIHQQSRIWQCANPQSVPKRISWKPSLPYTYGLLSNGAATMEQQPAAATQCTLEEGDAFYGKGLGEDPLTLDLAPNTTLFDIETV